MRKGIGSSIKSFSFLSFKPQIIAAVEKIYDNYSSNNINKTISNKITNNNTANNNTVNNNTVNNNTANNAVYDTYNLEKETQYEQRMKRYSI